MLISFKVFLGRFDARKMQAALLRETGRSTGQVQKKSSNHPEGVFDFSHCKNHNGHTRDSQGEEGFWFDFVSDCGDGFNPSYQISRLLAQPRLDIVTPSSTPSARYGRRTLPRGRLLINGGDLAYPDPTPENYEGRFFRTFEDAMPPPPSFRREHVSIRKGENARLLADYQGPCSFLGT